MKNKIKDGKDKKDEFLLPRFINFLKQINDILTGKKIYYLCADTHIFQEGIINILPGLEIKQYVVGTGGAEQDKIYIHDNISTKDGVIYTKSNEKKEFGFLVVDIKDSELSFEFVSANPEIGEMVAGSMKKYQIMNKRLLTK